MGTTYEQDIVAWANEQATLLRSGKFSAIDIEHIAEEIEDVGKSQQRELASRMAVLLTHLLKWQFQPEYRSQSWRNTINAQRPAIIARLDHTPSLKPVLHDVNWQREIWTDAIAKAVEETGLDISAFPTTCPWSMEQVLSQDFYPN